MYIYSLSDRLIKTYDINYTFESFSDGSPETRPFQHHLDLLANTVCHVLYTLSYTYFLTDILLSNDILLKYFPFDILYFAF